MPHVEHDYLSSLNQSDHCFPVSSLPLPSFDDANDKHNATKQWYEVDLSSSAFLWKPFVPAKWKDTHLGVCNRTY